MKGYPKYKNSGVELIGKIPSHWEKTKLRYVADSVKTGSTPSSDNVQYYNEGTIDWYSPGDFNGGIFLKYSKKKIAMSAINDGKAELFKKGSVFIVGIGATLGKIGVIEKEASSNQQINSILFIPTKVIPLYAAYLLNSSRQTILSLSNSATLPILNQSQTKEIDFLLPPIAEQKKMLKFLQCKTHRLDTLIEKKQKQIELLQEQRAAIINQAVTKGLNPDVPMKDSGIEWLGEVPEHWNRVQIKRVLSSIDYGISESLSGDGAIKVLTMGNIQHGVVSIPSSGSIDDVDPELLLRPFDLLFNRTNSRDLVAKVGIYKNEIDEMVTFASYLVRLRTNYKSDPEYLNYLFNSSDFICFARSLALHSINQSNLNSTKYSQIVIYLPLVREQRKIVKALQKICKVIAEKIGMEKKLIDLMNEYRTTLISEVVTGKIDVRDEVIPQ